MRWDGEAWKAYPQVFADFIAAVRSDFGQPELPFYFVQIGRFVVGGRSQGLERRAGAQRMLPERVPNTAVVSVIDLELDDGIHVGTQGLKRAGQRLARIAAARAVRPARGDHADARPRDPRARTTRWSSSSRASTWARATRAGPADDGQPRADGWRACPAWRPISPGDAIGIGLKPERHIAGFSIRKEDGTEHPADL